MDAVAIFVLQFLWFLTAWTVIAVLLVMPATSQLHPDDALAVWLAPQIFRVLGLGLLVPQLAPGMPRTFAEPTAFGDSLTALVALVAVVALRRRWQRSRELAWACNVIGSVDLAIALPHAASIRAAEFLAAQWYVPALGVPLMIVSHAMVFHALLRGRGK